MKSKSIALNNGVKNTEGSGVSRQCGIKASESGLNGGGEVRLQAPANAVGESAWGRPKEPRGSSPTPISETKIAGPEVRASIRRNQTREYKLSMLGQG